MKLKHLAVMTMAASMSLPVVADDTFTFNGYGRAGLSFSQDGGEQPARPELGNTSLNHATGRLGAENDTFLELDFNKEVAEDWKVQIMLAGGMDPQLNDEQDFETKLRQFNVQAKGVMLGGEEIFWAGKRYYQRHDIHWLDFYYLNNSGYGVGVEYIPLGDGLLSAALLNEDAVVAIDGDVTNTTDVQYNKIDLRYAMNIGLEFAAVIGASDPTDEQDQLLDIEGNGYFLTAAYSANGFFGGENGYNKLVAQYSDGSMGHMAYSNGTVTNKINENVTDGDIDSAYRLIYFGVADVNPNIEVGYSVVYANADRKDADDSSIISLVTRPAYHWNETNTTLLELGYADEDRDGKSTNLYKAIVAQEWSPESSLMSRPSIRVYGGAFGGDAAEDVDIDNEFRAGVQFEAWW